MNNAKEDPMAVWNQQVADQDAALGEGYTKTEYTFSTTERLQLLKIVGMNAFAKEIQTLAQQLTDSFLNLTVLIRVGVTPTPDKRVLYEPGVGRFCLWSPKSSTNSKTSAKSPLKSTSPQE